MYMCECVCVHVMCMQINRKPYSDDSMCRLISTFWFWYDIGWPARRLLLKQHCSSNICNMVKSILIQRMILIFNYDFFFSLFSQQKFDFHFESPFSAFRCVSLYIPGTFQKNTFQTRLSRFDNRSDLMEFHAILFCPIVLRLCNGISRYFALKIVHSRFFLLFNHTSHMTFFILSIKYTLLTFIMEIRAVELVKNVIKSSAATKQ